MEAQDEPFANLEWRWKLKAVQDENISLRARLESLTHSKREIEIQGEEMRCKYERRGLEIEQLQSQLGKKQVAVNAEAAAVDEFSQRLEMERQQMQDELLRRQHEVDQLQLALHVERTQAATSEASTGQTVQELTEHAAKYEAAAAEDRRVLHQLQEDLHRRQEDTRDARFKQAHDERHADTLRQLLLQVLHHAALLSNAEHPAIGGIVQLLQKHDLEAAQAATAIWSKLAMLPPLAMTVGTPPPPLSPGDQTLARSLLQEEVAMNHTVRAVLDHDMQSNMRQHRQLEEATQRTRTALQSEAEGHLQTRTALDHDMARLDCALQTLERPPPYLPLPTPDPMRVLPFAEARHQRFPELSEVPHVEHKFDWKSRLANAGVRSAAVS